MSLCNATSSSLAHKLIITSSLVPRPCRLLHSLGTRLHIGYHAVGMNSDKLEDEKEPCIHLLTMKGVPSKFQCYSGVQALTHSLVPKPPHPAWSPGNEAMHPPAVNVSFQTPKHATISLISRPSPSFSSLTVWLSIFVRTWESLGTTLQS